MREKGKEPPPSRAISRPNSLPLPFRTPATQASLFRKTLGNNDLNQVVTSSGFSENKGLGGGSVSRAHKTWSRSFLFKDFRLFRAKAEISRTRARGEKRKRVPLALFGN